MTIFRTIEKNDLLKLDLRQYYCAPTFKDIYNPLNKTSILKRKYLLKKDISVLLW